MKTEKTTESIFEQITESALFRTDGESIDLTEKLIRLCQLINEEDETNWYLGEGGECTLDALIVGAFFAYTEYHGGQSSETYACLCSLGSIFSPGMMGEPEEDTSEKYVYDAVCEYLEANK
jgi:hypothetical protein